MLEIIHIINIPQNEDWYSLPPLFSPLFPHAHLAYLQLRYGFLYPLIQPLLYTKNAEQLPQVFSAHLHLQVYFLRSSVNSHLHSESFKKKYECNQVVFCNKC